MKNNIKVILIILAAVIIVVLAFESVILVSVAKKGIRHILKMRTHMSKIAVRPFRASIAIKGFKIFNPFGYKEKIFADVSLILLDFKAKTFFEPGAFFDKIEIRIDKFNIVRDEEGVINITQMKLFEPQKEKEKNPFFAEKYIVSIDKVCYIDRTKPEGKQVREIELNNRWEKKNVKNPDNLLSNIIFRVFLDGKIIGLGLELQNLQKELAKLTEDEQGAAELTEKQKQEEAQKTKKGIAEQVETAVGKVKENAEKLQETVQEKTREIKEVVDDKVKEVVVQVQEATEAKL